mmetsp:Transcript_20213/g.69642  ORF Transcript_20213/g.69642 Transcript_20213/m.69642 type:complete len:240 (-) Transcript_20213:243-962(-)
MYGTRAASSWRALSPSIEKNCAAVGAFANAPSSPPSTSKKRSQTFGCASARDLTSSTSSSRPSAVCVAPSLAGKTSKWYSVSSKAMTSSASAARYTVGARPPCGSRSAPHRKRECARQRNVQQPRSNASLNATKARASAASSFVSAARRATTNAHASTATPRAPRCEGPSLGAPAWGWTAFATSSEQPIAASWFASKSSSSPPPAASPSSRDRKRAVASKAWTTRRSSTSRLWSTFCAF